MKRYGNLYDKVCTIENVKLAIRNASKGKRSRKSVCNILNHENEAAEAILKLLVNKTYEPKPYREFTIKDGAAKKERTIYCPAFYPDQIIHWALMQVIEPFIMKSMYVYAQDIAEKSRIARSAKNHVTKGKWRMSDGNGETQSVQIGKYISRENFKSLPKSMQREYYVKSMDAYHIGPASFAEMWGITRMSIFYDFKNLSICIPKGKREHRKDRDNFMEAIANTSQAAAEEIKPEESCGSIEHQANKNVDELAKAIAMILSQGRGEITITVRFGAEQ